MSRTKNITEIDKAMAFKEQTLDGMNWYSVDSEGFVLDGLYWRKKGGVFRRLPSADGMRDGSSSCPWDIGSPH